MSAIDILLSTYNGADYLPEQLDSLFGQTCQDWRLLVRDDGSTDGTRDILERCVAMGPGRVTILPPDGERLGASMSFGRLLDQSISAYVMFCDQDDVWLPDKVEVALVAMRNLERVHGKGTPLLVSTDLKVVDERMGLVDESFWRVSRIHPERLTKLSRVLMQNFATGCTTMINRPLADLAKPMPSEALMHDWWLAMVATAFGECAALPRATVLYRQHGRNVAGVSTWSFLAGVKNFLFHRDRRRAAISRRDEILARLRAQAQAFAARFCQTLTKVDEAALDAFCQLPNKGFLGRRVLMVRHGLLPSDRWQSFMTLVG